MPQYELALHGSTEPANVRPSEELSHMYIYSPRGRRKDRTRSNRKSAKLKAKNRRRKNRMAGTRLSAR